MRCSLRMREIAESKQNIFIPYSYIVAICLCVCILLLHKPRRRKKKHNTTSATTIMNFLSDVDKTFKFVGACASPSSCGAQAKNIEFSVRMCTARHSCHTNNILNVIVWLLYNFQWGPIRRAAKESREANSDQKRAFSNSKANMYRDHTDTHTLVATYIANLKIINGLAGQHGGGDSFKLYAHNLPVESYSLPLCLCYTYRIHIHYFHGERAIGGSVCSIPSHDQASRGRYNLCFLFTHTHTHTASTHYTVASHHCSG